MQNYPIPLFWNLRRGWKPLLVFHWYKMVITASRHIQIEPWWTIHIHTVSPSYSKIPPIMIFIRLTQSTRYFSIRTQKNGPESRFLMWRRNNKNDPMGIDNHPQAGGLQTRFW